MTRGCSSLRTFASASRGSHPTFQPGAAQMDLLLARSVSRFRGDVVHCGPVCLLPVEAQLHGDVLSLEQPQQGEYAHAWGREVLVGRNPRQPVRHVAFSASRRHQLFLQPLGRFKNCVTCSLFSWSSCVPQRQEALACAAASSGACTPHRSDSMQCLAASSDSDRIHSLSTILLLSWSNSEIEPMIGVS